MVETRADDPAVSVRLPWGTKIGYGTAELGMSAVEVMLQLYLLEYYTRVVGLRAELAGYALALAVLWDAVTDPLMGTVSDHSNSRWGKRRPYILIGSVILASAFSLIFSPLDFSSQAGKFAFLLASYIFVNTGMTVVAIPHAALGGELTFDRNERTEVFGWRLLFRNGGFLLGTLLPGYLLTTLEASNGNGDYGSRAIAGYWVGATVFVCGTITVLSVRKIDTPEVFAARGDRLRGVEFWSMVKSISAVGRNRVFLPLLLAYVFAQAGRTINSSLALYYYKIRLDFTEQDVVFYVFGLFVVVISLSIGVWVFLSRRYGKKWPSFLAIFSLGVLCCITYPFYPPGLLWPPLVFSSVLGGFAVGSIILFESLVADIVDYDELMTGEQREGAYFGCWTMATKIARAIGLASTGILLNAVGLVEGAESQAPEVGFRIAMLFGPLVGFAFITAGLIFTLMPLTDDRHRRVQRLLAQRRTRRMARDRET